MLNTHSGYCTQAEPCMPSAHCLTITHTASGNAAQRSYGFPAQTIKEK